VTTGPAVAVSGATPASPTASTSDHTVEPLNDYHDLIVDAAARMGRSGARQGQASADLAEPALSPPSPQDGYKEYYAAARIGIAPLRRSPGLVGNNWRLLNLMLDPTTRTAKTSASLLIVARAIEHTRRNGGKIALVTPSSGNKATALRSAVARAYDLGLTSSDKVRVLSVMPLNSAAKARASRFDPGSHAHRANPLVVHRTASPDQVKGAASAFVNAHGEQVRKRYGFDLWPSLNLDNYRLADCARAFAESELFGAGDRAASPRTHVHAVSSAYGLLGYSLGVEVLQSAGRAVTHPALFVIQHLRTSDMVRALNKHLRSVGPPVYEYDTSSGVWVQHTEASYPTEVLDPAESIDPTFYTERPATAAPFNQLVERVGGGGLVVGLMDCLALYPQVRSMVAGCGISMPSDPRSLREWSLVMALTGLMLGSDRGLLDGREVVLHASGSYDDDELPPAPAGSLLYSRDQGELDSMLLRSFES